mmetsp:Transcript_8540/g.17306  ORF Transcript_8540/g.17306 Transcript_8540/m.17306 type:complete len:88 (-) Transcript_8540:1606-1869(-)
MCRSCFVGYLLICLHHGRVDSMLTPCFFWFETRNRVMTTLWSHNRKDGLGCGFAQETKAEASLGSLISNSLVLIVFDQGFVPPTRGH